MTQILSLPRAEFRSVRDRFSRRRRPTTRQRVLDRTLAGRAVRLAVVGGAGLGAAVLLRRRKGAGGVGVGGGGYAPYPNIPKPKAPSTKRLANSAKVARRRAESGKPAKAVQGGLKGRTTAERRSISNRVKRGATEARARLGANYRLHYRLTHFS